MRQDIPQSVYSHNRITHPNHLIGDKFQFFIDCLNKMCVHSGEFYHYEIEHHISLINHMIFMIDCEVARPNDRNKYCIVHIKHICASHPLLNNDDLVISESDNKGQIKKILEKIFDEPVLSTDFITTLNNLKLYLVQLRNQFEPTYFKDIINSLSQKICCKHSLRYHSRHLEYISKLCFSYYHLHGYSRKAINTITKKIFKSKVIKSGQKIYSEAYLPLELYQKMVKHNRNNEPFNKKLFNEIQRYLSRRNQMQQVQQLSDVLHYEKYDYKLLFRLEGLILFADKEKSEIDILGVKIMPTTEFKKKHDQFNFNDTGAFFIEDRSAIAEITAAAYNQEDAVFLALENLRNKLGKIMRITNSRFSLSRIGCTSYSYDEKAFWINTMPEVAKVSHYDVEDLNYIEGKISDTPHKEFYLELDQILLEAFLEDNITTAIHYLRKFIEILNKNTKTSKITASNGIPSDIKTVAYLLTYFEKGKFRQQTIDWVHNKMINSDFLTESGELLSRKYSSEVITNNRQTSFPLIAKYIYKKQLHEKYEFNRARYYSKYVDEKLAFEYYCRQLLYIKQYRDKHEHANITDDIVARKLGVYSYRLLNRLLRNIFHEICKPENAERPIGEILREMAIEAKNRLGE